MATGKGGEKLQKALGEIGRALSGASVVRIGFLEGATYPSGGYRSLNPSQLSKVLSGGKVRRSAAIAGGGKPVAMIAAIQEFGAPSRGIPPRPYFRNMIREKKGEWPSAIAIQLKETKYDAAKTLGRTGEAIAGQLRQSIRDLVTPPLARSTIRRKGFDKPLVDTAHMLQSVDYEVKA